MQKIRTFLLSLIVLFVGTAALSAERPTVRSVELRLPQRADAPVLRHLMETVPDRAYIPQGLADDLSRLGMMGYQLEQVEVEFEEGEIDVRLVASETDEPERVRLASIELVGGISEIDRQIRAGLSQRPPAFPHRRQLDYHRLLDWDTWGVEAQYRGLGYLDAKVRKLSINVEDGDAAITLEVVPGRQYSLGRITVRGAEQVTPADVLEAIGTDGPPHWNEAMRHRIRSRAARHLRDRGFLDAEVEVEARKGEETVDAVVRITEGPRVSLNHAMVRDAGEHEPAVAELIDFQQGQTVTQPQLDGLRREIEDLGLFRRVELALVPLRDTPEGVRDLVIKVEPVEFDRDIGEAERLFYDAAKNFIRLYNEGEEGIRSIKLDGFVVFGGARLQLDATLVRPDYARVRLTLPPGGYGGPQQMLFYRKGDQSMARIGRLDKGWDIPAASAGVKLDIQPPNWEARLPARLDLAFGVFKGTAHSDVILLGDRCPLAAAYDLEQAQPFRRSPPQFENERTIALPPAGPGDGPTRLRVDENNLPELITLHNADGEVTAHLHIALNSPEAAREAAEAGPPEPEADDPAGSALLAPMLHSLQLPGAGELAEELAAEHPDDPAALAARGLVRLASGMVEQGIDDLTAAADRSEHPAYKLILAEILIRADRFEEAARVCERLLDADVAAPEALDVADLLLAQSVSPAAAMDQLRSSPPDYRHRATIDAALANIGMGRYDRAAELARGLLAERPDDGQAAEMLARAELGRGDPRAALDAINKVGDRAPGPEPWIYAALAHLWLDDEQAATQALARAMAISRSARNLVELQERAEELNRYFEPAEIQAKLAAVFSRAALGELDDDQRAELAAIVNDVRIPREHVDHLVMQAQLPEELTEAEFAEIWDEAREYAIEEALIVRWAVWRDLGSPQILQQLDREMAEEMEALEVRDMESYARALAQYGTTPEERRHETFRQLLKRAAFSAVLADTVLVRPAQVREYYESRPDEIREPDSVTFRMITLHYARYDRPSQAVALAEALRRRLIEEPDKFPDFAKQYSHDQRAADGGLWEDVKSGQMIEPLDEVVFDLEPGEISPVIQTDRTCHLVRVKEIDRGEKLSLEEAAGHIARAMQDVTARREVAQWISRLIERSYIEKIGGPPQRPEEPRLEPEGPQFEME